MATVKKITAAVLVGGLTLGAGGTALAGHIPTARAATSPDAAHAHQTHHRQRHTHAALMVKSVSGTTISAMRGARAITVTVSPSTIYKEAGQMVPLAAVRPGERIAVRGTHSGQGTIQARVVRIILSRVAGRITAVNGSSYMLATARGVTHVVVTTSSTTYKARGTAATSASALAVGTRIVARGTLSPDGKTLTATRIVVRPAVARHVRSSTATPQTVRIA